MTRITTIIKDETYLFIPSLKGVGYLWEGFTKGRIGRQEEYGDTMLLQLSSDPTIIRERERERERRRERTWSRGKIKSRTLTIRRPDAT